MRDARRVREGDPMITVERLTKRYGPFTAVDDVSFEVKPGLVTGFLGPNGAGKTTAMRIMAGLTPATSGTRHRARPPYAALPNPGRHVGLLLDASAQHAGRTGREVLTLGAILMGVRHARASTRWSSSSGSPTRRRTVGSQLLPRHAPAPRHRARAAR